MVITIIREHHYTPKTIDSLYFDSVDHYGIGYLYDDIKKIVEKINSKTAKKK